MTWPDKKNRCWSKSLKNANGINADWVQSMFILTILEKKDFRKKIKETRLKFSQGSATVL